MSDGYCNCSKCGYREHRPVFRKEDGKYSRRPCSKCSRNRYLSTFVRNTTAGKSSKKPTTRRDRLIQAAHNRTFNEDGSLNLIPLGRSKQSYTKEELKKRAAEALARINKKKKKKNSRFNGSCRPIDKSPFPKPPKRDGDGDGDCGGPAHNSQLPNLAIQKPLGAR